MGVEIGGGDVIGFLVEEGGGLAAAAGGAAFGYEALGVAGGEEVDVVALVVGWGGAEAVVVGSAAVLGARGAGGEGVGVARGVEDEAGGGRGWHEVKGRRFRRGGPRNTRKTRKKEGSELSDGGLGGGLAVFGDAELVVGIGEGVGPLGEAHFAALDGKGVTLAVDRGADEAGVALLDFADVADALTVELRSGKEAVEAGLDGDHARRGRAAG